MVSERYQSVEAILLNVMRFCDYQSKGIINHQMLCEQMYWGIRRDYAKELLAIIEGGGDAYSRLAKITENLKEQ